MHIKNFDLKKIANYIKAADSNSKEKKSLSNKELSKDQKSKDLK